MPELTLTLTLTLTFNQLANILVTKFRSHFQIQVSSPVPIYVAAASNYRGPVNTVPTNGYTSSYLRHRTVQYGWVHSLAGQQISQIHSRRGVGDQ